MYDRPPIACHHDFSQAALDVRAFPPNVRFVHPHLKTGWGKWSLVQASLDGIRLLYDGADPGWFVLLSAADYPIRPAAAVLEDLRRTTADVLIDYREIPMLGDPLVPSGTRAEHAQHGSPDNVRLNRSRFLHLIAKVPLIRFRPPFESTTASTGVRVGAHTLTFPVRPPFSPFRNGFRCFVGSQWFTARAAFARKLIAGGPAQRRLARHLRHRVVPDECFFQSLACNDAELRVDPDPRRFVQWGAGGAHPADLTIADLDTLRGSGDHFARKFGPDMAVRDRLDALNGVSLPAKTIQP